MDTKLRALILLLAGIAAGDRESLRQLYARYSRPLFSVAMRMLSDRGAAGWALATAADAARTEAARREVLIMEKIVARAGARSKIS